jgi:uncharacterized protein with HEPN domain
MPREILKLLWDMKLAGESVAEFLQGKSLTDYQQDKMLRSAVERQLFIIGEALSQIARWDNAFADGFSERRQIIGFRNMLAHGYSDLVDERVYTIANVDLPLLMAEVNEFLPS